jgi:hypothetical protein
MLIICPFTAKEKPIIEKNYFSLADIACKQLNALVIR